MQMSARKLAHSKLEWVQCSCLGATIRKRKKERIKEGKKPQHNSHFPLSQPCLDRFVLKHQILPPGRSPHSLALSFTLPSLLFHYPISGPICPLESLPPCKLWQSLTRGEMRKARLSMRSSQRLGLQKHIRRVLSVHVSCPSAARSIGLPLQGHERVLWSVTLQSLCLKLQGSKWELSEQLSQITNLEGARWVSAPNASAGQVSKALRLPDKCNRIKSVSER